MTGVFDCVFVLCLLDGLFRGLCGTRVFIRCWHTTGIARSPDFTSGGLQNTWDASGRRGLAVV